MPADAPILPVAPAQVGEARPPVHDARWARHTPAGGCLAGVPCQRGSAAGRGTPSMPPCGSMCAAGISGKHPAREGSWERGCPARKRTTAGPQPPKVGGMRAPPGHPSPTSGIARPHSISRASVIRFAHSPGVPRYAHDLRGSTASWERGRPARTGAKPPEIECGRDARVPRTPRSSSGLCGRGTSVPRSAHETPSPRERRR